MYEGSNTHSQRRTRIKWEEEDPLDRPVDKIELSWLVGQDTLQLIHFCPKGIKFDKGVRGWVLNKIWLI